MKTRRLIRPGAVAVSALLLVACQSSFISRVTSIDTSKYYAVKASEAPFFRYGPQQGNGPDMRLPKDTLVNLIRPSFGYAKVRLVASGEQGYVASEDITVAPPMLVAALNAPPPEPEMSSALEEESSFDPAGLTPPPADELPDPDLPAASPSPSLP